MIRITKKKYLNQFVKITFDDHFTSDDPTDDDCECWVLGKVVSIAPRKLRVRYWHANGQPEGSGNHEYVVVFRSLIKKIRILK